MKSQNKIPQNKLRNIKQNSPKPTKLCFAKASQSSPSPSSPQKTTEYSATENKIYIDIDDVLSQTGETLVALLDIHFKKKIPLEDIHDFDLQKSFDLTRQEFERLLHIFHDEAVIKSIKPVAGAVESLRTLSKMHYDIQVMTGRPTLARVASQAWLNEQKIPHTQLMFVDKYAHFPREQTGIKALSLDELSQMKFAFAIEDSQTMAHFLVTKMNTPVFLMTRPWNKKFDHTQFDGKITRCNDWAEIMKHIL